MIVVASTNGRVGIQEAMEVLRRGGSALDAVEAGTRLVEANAADHSVGLGGLPNLVGEVELDASIMDGQTRACGAVGALHGYLHAISVARRVMEELPHVFLVGEGAARFAAEMGFPRQDLLTPESRAAWEARLVAASDAASAGSTEPGLRRYYQAMAARAERAAHEANLTSVEPVLARAAHLAADPERPNETVNFIARDGRGAIACAVSTSGWAWKYPGRLGDSPVIGAGNYADSRYGAAACTGRGEMAIRACTAFSVVAGLRRGLPLAEACTAALADTLSLEDEYAGHFSLVALDGTGRPAAASNRPGTTYVVMTPEMTECEERERLVVAGA